MFILMFVLLMLALGAGSWGFSRWGYAAVSPAGVVFVLLLLLYYTGHLHFRA